MSQPLNCASKYQPFPCFYVYRPGYLVVPLIPLDELPWWIQVGDFNWTDSALYESMLPASFNCFPRIGEYDVVCHHCYAPVDSFHRSVSERSNSNASSHASNAPKGLAAAVSSKKAVLDHPYILKQPPFEASFNTSPFVGMCLYKCPILRSLFRLRRPQDAQTDNHDAHQDARQDAHQDTHQDGQDSDQHNVHRSGHHRDRHNGHTGDNNDNNNGDHNSSLSHQGRRGTPRDIVRDENTTPPLEDTMTFTIDIDNNNNTSAGNNLIPDSGRSDTVLGRQVVAPSMQTEIQRSAASSPGPDVTRPASDRHTSSESTLWENPRAGPILFCPRRRRVRFEWPAVGLRPVRRRTGPGARVIER